MIGGELITRVILTCWCGRSNGGGGGDFVGGNIDEGSCGGVSGQW